MKKNAYSQEEFINKVATINPNIVVTGTYTGVENKIEIECLHLGKNMVYAYSLLKPRHCCRIGYHANRIPAMKKDIDSRIAEYSSIFGDALDFTKSSIKSQKLENIICNKHKVTFEQWFSSLKQGVGCPACGKENKKAAGIKMLSVARKKQLERGNAKFVSKAETKWLDELNVPIRQYWLNDIKYCVDGYDPGTNTVYLYHGRFWHGCLQTYNPEDVHPILKVTMKQLNDQTLVWEQRIKESGYNLISKWGK
jgi:hypothetical protein